MREEVKDIESFYSIYDSESDSSRLEPGAYDH